MIFPLRHRGPDGYGFFNDDQVGLAHARLSIIDLEGGWQPIHNEDKSLWVIFNGEIFNYIELRTTLEKNGHKFYTKSDTEVIVHLYEEKREKCLEDLNGQFAIAIYDARNREFFLARDRLGIRPLFYTFHKGTFYFASEIKSLFAASPDIPRRINPEILLEIFTLWSPAGENSVFSGIKQLLPGHWAFLKESGKFVTKEYWDIPTVSSYAPHKKENDYAEELLHLLIDSVRLRLRADVPVGAYLSGGIDSSAITSIIQHYTNNPLKTFSITFADEVYDERHEQNIMVDYLHTDHHTIDCSYSKIAETFPEVIWNTEIPLLRTAPTPLFLLSRLVRKNNFKVVLTGEGADEILAGYDIFKEAKIRAFIHSHPSSLIRPFLLKRLYPYLALSPTRSTDFSRKFFDTGASTDDLFYAHGPRWKTTSRTTLFFEKEVIENFSSSIVIEKLTNQFAKKLQGLDLLSRAQYLEIKLLLANYLLSSQGDRMAMANSVEGRFPFLDHRLVEYAFSIPPRYRMKVLNEKNILRKMMRNILPRSILERKKQPYMAPDIFSFFGEKEPLYLSYYFSEELIKEAGFFKPGAVKLLVAKCKRNSRQGFGENMAFVGMLSTQILFDKFIKNFKVAPPTSLDNVKIIR